MAYNIAMETRENKNRIPIFQRIFFPLCIVATLVFIFCNSLQTGEQSSVTSGGVVTQYQTPVLNSNSASYEVSITVKDGPVDITVSTHWGKATVPGAVQITDNTLVLTGVATATISETTATETTETTETEIGTGATDD